MGRVSYTPMVGGRVFTLAIFVVFGVAAVFLVFSVVTDQRHSPPVWFAVLWLLALAWNAYWLLWRLSYLLEFADGTLTWAAPLRSGSISSADIVRIYRFPLLPQLSIFEARGRPSVLCYTVAGFSEFAAVVAGDRIPVPRAGIQERANRLFGVPSAFRREEPPSSG